MKVTGIFKIEVDAKCYQEAKAKAERILRDSGIDGQVVEVKECDKE